MQTSLRRVFGDKTNVQQHDHSPKANPAKRRAQDEADQKPPKHPKLENHADQECIPRCITSTSRSFSDASHRILRRAAANHRPTHPLSQLSTRPILQSFVSSKTSDSYKFFKPESTALFDLPTSCSYTNDSKTGAGKPLLAVATESGSIEILDTSRRQPWEFPERVTMNITNNMIFDVKWSTDDQRLAVASADHCVHIVSPARPESSSLRLSGHTGSVKVVVWDPNHRASASRSGGIVWWDLRERPSTHDLEDVFLESSRSIMDAERILVAGQKKRKPVVRSVTSLLYLPHEPHYLVSSGSSDGILKKWDRRMVPNKTSHAECTSIIEPAEQSSTDITLRFSKRSRGISSLALSSTTIYGLGRDSRIHEYPVQLSQHHHSRNEYSLMETNMNTSTFYSRVSCSPCDRWMAAGNKDGSVTLFEIGSKQATSTRGVRLQGHDQEVGGLDWSRDCLATCSDDTTIRIWRPDDEVSRVCRAEPEKSSWDWSWVRDI